MDNTYYQKYIKYKRKYTQLSKVKQLGGEDDEDELFRVKTKQDEEKLSRVMSKEPTNKIKGNLFQINDTFKDLLKSQIKEYIDALKKIQLGKVQQNPPEKIEEIDIIHPNNLKYQEIETNFYSNKNSYDEPIRKKIESLFEAKIPLVLMKQVLRTKAYYNYGYKKAAEDKIFYNGHQGEHWYLLPREFNERFGGEDRNIYRLNRFLGFQPFHNMEFQTVAGSTDSVQFGSNSDLGIHTCYVFLNYLSTPQQNPNPLGIIKDNDYFVWNTREYSKYLAEKFENVNLKCFCNYLEKGFEFNNNLNKLFEAFDNNEEGMDINKFVERLNNLINNYLPWDFIMFTLPWTGQGRTLDWGTTAINFSGASEFVIPQGKYLKDKEFVPILTESFNSIDF